jgi:cell division protein FtsL
MEIFIGVNLLLVDLKEKAFIGGLMGLYIKVDFKVVYFMEKEYGVQNKMITMKANIA